MKNKILGVILMFIGLSLFQGSILSFTNSTYPVKKALITGGFLLILSIYPLIKGVKLFRKKAISNEKDNEEHNKS